MYYIGASAIRPGTCGFEFGSNIRADTRRCARTSIARLCESSSNVACKFLFLSVTCICDRLFRLVLSFHGPSSDSLRRSPLSIWRSILGVDDRVVLNRRQNRKSSLGLYIHFILQSRV